MHQSSNVTATPKAGLLRAERLAAKLERKPFITVFLLTALYSCLVAVPLQKILWHDELFTFYIAQSPTLHSFVDSVQHVDWQPPLIFASAWLSQHIFGVNEFGTRLPSVLSFFAASLGLFFLLKPRIGVLWSTVPVLLLWFSFYFKYATEARPYGLLAGFFMLSLFSYDRATGTETPPRSRWAVAGVFLGNMGMMLSHVLAPFSMMPFGVAELVRTAQRRKLDWAMWFAIVAPLAVVAGYAPFVHGFEENYFPYIFQASLRKIAVFFVKAFMYVWPLLLLGILAAFAAARLSSKRPNSEALPRFAPHQIALIAALLSPPVLVNLIMMRSAGAFWERYCITSAIVIYLLCALAIGSLARFSRVAALAVIPAMLIGGIAETVSEYRPSPPLHLLEAIRPDLPLVAASGLAFLEMDHYERPVLLKRLYYLTDRPSAIRYAHATLFEGFGTLNRHFPLRATVRPYYEFTRSTKHFLVFATPESQEDWLLRKLSDDGAAISRLRPVQSPYRDYMVFEVTMPR